MPTFRHKETGKRIFFAHIPRTAGRFVEANLLENGFTWDDEYLNQGYGVMSVVNGYEIAHYHREHYEKYLDVEGIPHFSIVRNPITKFISGSIYLKRTYGDDIQSVMEDPYMFSSMIENLPLEGSLNWYRPQVDFISDKTHLWRFEDGFGEDFGQWMGDVLEVPFKIVDVPYQKLSYDESNKLERTDKLIDNIRTICRKDIEQLYPELAAPL